ncbi:selenium-binding protein [Seongchinamella unica]|uniref:Methanethiol oxidase n=1 Tax=Seongchinamella unica TaxID=2547392 RepID=A0A4R5LNI3_9GAMM|nr:selenium-binding protein SBP56-related protein [Seongchinamella unica]TDG11884.1 selenium-binding protein [Seongchinamella unica]
MRLILALLFILSSTTFADETCMSPYMAKIKGQEDFVYVWTLGMPGVGDEQDKLVTVDVNPASENFGKVVNSLSVGGRNEAHHTGLTDDRRYLWASGLDTSKIFIFDVHTNPAKPTLSRTISDFVAKSGGVVGPHTNYALPGRMMVTGLSNNRDHGGRTAMVEYTNAGDYVATYWMPTADKLQGAVQSGKFADGFGYDVRALPRRNVMVSSSFTGWNNYMMNLGTLMGDAEAMKAFGNTVVIWDLHARQPRKILDVPGSPLEIRCAWNKENNYCFTTTALTSKIWLIYEDDEGEWQAKDVGDIGEASKVPLPVDISISNDDQQLWVNTWNDGLTRLYDISDPFNARQVYSKKIGEQVNMVSQSWDGKRVYYTSSLLANWDKQEPKGPDLQYLKLYSYDGDKLEPSFSIDFVAEKLGAPHQMRFGAYSLYQGKVAGI